MFSKTNLRLPAHLGLTVLALSLLLSLTAGTFSNLPTQPPAVSDSLAALPRVPAQEVQAINYLPDCEREALQVWEDNTPAAPQPVDRICD